MKNHILIVDDEQNIREVCKELLEEEGYKVTLAVDGQDALDKMDIDSYDLFLIDMAMPRIGGLDLMKMIKKKQPLAVIIILTGFSSIEGAVKAVHAGAFQYLSKPINADELIEAVKSGLQYSQDLYGPLQKAFEPATDVNKKEPIMLHGFTPEEKVDFMELGHIRKFDIGENIALGENQAGSIIVVESGDVSIWLNNTTVDYLQKWDSFGEESFILAGTSSNFSLRAETVVKVRYFERKKLLDFFAYKGEKLLKRFMINLVNGSYFKWRKSIKRIVMLKLVTGDRQ